MEDSELHAPSIRQLISERIKYKVPVLNIVSDKRSTRASKMADKSDDMS